MVDPDGADGVLGTEDDTVRLGFQSPCIDAGTNAGVTTDYQQVVCQRQRRGHDELDGPEPRDDL